MKDNAIETNPAFGMIGFNRVSGSGQVFFGSSVESSNFITLRIYQAEVSHDLSQDRYMRSEPKPMIEVALTSAQFAELLTSMNVGDGVPCTIQAFNGERIPPLDTRETEGKRVRASFRESMDERTENFHRQRKDIEEILKKDRLNKEDRNRISTLLYSVGIEYDSNMPFALEQFERATKRMEVQAKAEVEAFITNAVIKTGLERLKEQQPTLRIGSTQGDE